MIGSTLVRSECAANATSSAVPIASGTSTLPLPKPPWAPASERP